MCTGAELAAAGAAAAGTAGTAAAGADAAATGAAALGGGLGSMSGLLAAPEAFAAPSVATAGTSALAAAAPRWRRSLQAHRKRRACRLDCFRASVKWGSGASEHPCKQNEGFGLGGLNSTLQSANPTYSAASNILGKGADALGNYNKVQSGMNMMRPQQSGGAATVSKAAEHESATDAASCPSDGWVLGKQQQIPDGARLMMLKRMGLLGSM
jgi:hypothetical protein